MHVIKKTSRKKLFLSLIVGVLLVGGVGVPMAYHLHKKDSSQTGHSGVNQVNYGAPKKEDSAQTSSSKNDVAQKPADPDGKPEPAQPTAPVSATLTQAQQQDATITIRALVNGTNSGTCQLTLSQGGQPDITRSAAVGVQANYAICQGFDLPTSDFPTSGNWSLSLVIQTSSGTSTPAQRNIQVTK
jgi:cytoskeletal protein RodZ